MIECHNGGMLENCRGWVRDRPDQQETWSVPEGGP